MTFYLINGVVEFNPQTRGLKNQLTGNVVYLQQPAATCFLYLILNQGVVIAQKELVEQGWKERDVVTMPNTFYQTILTLRKALEEVGLPRNMVKTISRQGLTLSSTIMIEPFDLHNAAITERPSIKTVVSDNVLSEKMPTRKSRGVKIGVSFFLVVTVINCIFIYQDRLNMPFQNFVMIPMDKRTDYACNVYYEVTQSVTDNYYELIKKHPNLCRGNNYIFLTGYSKTGRTAAFICNKDVRFDTGAFCSSHFFWSRSL
ncbi:winged helix-turn-helix domain-containing protein [Citrobacter farmeri]|uniref:winged helix-turn-helix domain-containing protein n=1 Tax=Citrobacter farmeri TaxID=67824 RepID=UPI001903E77E|nr:winged helix-turn-helix domain-containing protein [Citrobacter farmeri]MBJ9161864.1 winged helix-turn-helix domain-containing protein [Citrobacter farmeri]HCD7255053.1 winged helix-turn-helix domain-containing protein [Citrobacter farmeri]HCD7554082.1 winged helix-turn-helix domain-containing protein [Citrobacter farmeri]HCD7631716.1 winged helix-turn-helix domain-containing protein [Citrobacter farmeri]